MAGEDQQGRDDLLCLIRDVGHPGECSGVLLTHSIYSPFSSGQGAVKSKAELKRGARDVHGR